MRTYADKLAGDGKPDPNIQRGVSRITVTSALTKRGKRLTLALAPTGGAALWLTPAK